MEPTTVLSDAAPADAGAAQGNSAGVDYGASARPFDFDAALESLSPSPASSPAPAPEIPAEPAPEPPADSVADPKPAASSAGDAPEDAATAGTPDPSTPAPEPPKLSRREQEAQKLRDELAQARQEAAAAKAALAARDAGPSPLEIRNQLCGPDDEFRALNDRPYYDLPYEDQVKLDGWKANRALERPFTEYATTTAQQSAQGFVDSEMTRINAHLMQEAVAVADKFGLDRDVVTGDPLYGNVITHAVEVTEARVRAETADRITQLEAENRSFREGRMAAAPTPEQGGQGVGGAARPAGWNPERPHTENLDRLFA